MFVRSLASDGIWYQLQTFLPHTSTPNPRLCFPSTTNTAPLSQVLVSLFPPSRCIFLSTYCRMSSDRIKVMRTVKTVSLKPSRNRSSYGLWTHVNDGGSGEALRCPREVGSQVFVLVGHTRKLKSFGRLAGGHTERRRKILGWISEPSLSGPAWATRPSPRGCGCSPAAFFSIQKPAAGAGVSQGAPRQGSRGEKV